MKNNDDVKLDSGKIISREFYNRLLSVKGKRAKFVVDTIMKKGSCSTEDLQEAGYQHAPRAARDVREEGIPLITEHGQDKSGKKMGVYVLGDWNEAYSSDSLTRTKGRSVLSNKLKEALIQGNGNYCALYGEKYEERLLQVDHRIPYEINGDPENMNDTQYFMLLCPSANRLKSWSCEHCSNWTKKDPSMCRKCYFAYPENYDHIAGVKEKTVNLSFRDNDYDIYKSIEELSKKENISIQEATKEILSSSLKK